MLPSYTKPNIQSVQPGMTGSAAPATPNGYVTPTGYDAGANPITASRGAVADMTAAPAMPANPQVQTQRVPQAWQTQQYTNHLQSLYAARPDLAGLGSLQQSKGIPGMTGNTNIPEPAVPAHLDWRNRGAATAVQEKTGAPISLTANTNTAVNQGNLYKREQDFWNKTNAVKQQFTAPPPTAAPAKAASPVRSAVTNGKRRSEDSDHNRANRQADAKLRARGMSESKIRNRFG